jgi:hypothetical protein
MAAVAFLTQQQLAPVVLDVGQVHGEVDGCDVEEYGSQLRIYQDTLIEELHKSLDVFATIQVGRSARDFRRDSHVSMLDDNVCPA